MGQHPESMDWGGLEAGSMVEAMNRDLRGLRKGKTQRRASGMVRGYLTWSQERWLAFHRGCGLAV